MGETGISVSGRLTPLRFARDIDDGDGVGRVAVRHMEPDLAVIDEKRVARLQRAQDFRMRQMDPRLVAGLGV
jgi:hypothetical protein